MPRWDVKSLLSTCSCLLRLALSKRQRFCQRVECVGSFGLVLLRMLRTCWACGGQTLPLTCACCCFPSCSCILASICCIRWICGAKSQEQRWKGCASTGIFMLGSISAASAGPVEQSQEQWWNGSGHIYVMINICCIHWICGAKSLEQWWKGHASTGIFMLRSASAASAGSAVQSHEQWWNGSGCIYVIIDICCIHWICEAKPWAMIHLSAPVASAWPAKKGKCNSKIGHSWINLLKWL